MIITYLSFCFPLLQSNQSDVWFKFNLWLPLISLYYRDNLSDDPEGNLCSWLKEHIPWGSTWKLHQLNQYDWFPLRRFRSCHLYKLVCAIFFKMLILAYNFSRFNYKYMMLMLMLLLIVNCWSQLVLFLIDFSSIAPVENNQSKNTKSFMNVLRVFFFNFNSHN